MNVKSLKAKGFCVKNSSHNEKVQRDSFAVTTDHTKDVLIFRTKMNKYSTRKQNIIQMQDDTSDSSSLLSCRCRYTSVYFWLASVFENYTCVQIPSFLLFFLCFPSQLVITGIQSCSKAARFKFIIANFEYGK